MTQHLASIVHGPMATLSTSHTRTDGYFLYVSYTDRWLLFVRLIHGPMSVLGDGEGTDGQHAAGGGRLQP